MGSTFVEKSLARAAGLASVLAVVVVTAIISFLSIVLSELTAKRLAMQRPEEYALALAPMVSAIAKAAGGGGGGRADLATAGAKDPARLAEAMIVAQVIIAFPLVAGFTMAAVQGVDPALRLQVQSLGASRWQTTWAILDEARVGVIAAVVAGFGGIISEVGAVMLVGGNIEGQTRVLTTAIVLETNKGNFGLAMALGVILLSMAFTTNFIILRLQGRSFDE